MRVMINNDPFPSEVVFRIFTCVRCEHEVRELEVFKLFKESGGEKYPHMLLIDEEFDAMQLPPTDNHIDEEKGHFIESISEGDKWEGTLGRFFILRPNNPMKSSEEPQVTLSFPSGWYFIDVNIEENLEISVASKHCIPYISPRGIICRQCINETADVDEDFWSD